MCATACLQAVFVRCSSLNSAALLASKQWHTVFSTGYRPIRLGVNDVKRIARILALTVPAVSLLLVDAANGQSTGRRSFGSSPSRRQGPGSSSRLQRGSRMWDSQPNSTGSDAGATDVGTLVDERFVRGARAAGDFIGTDSQERQTFVGSQQSGESGPVRSAQEGLRIESGPDANQGQTQKALTNIGMYNPRLRVAFDFSRRPVAEVSSTLAARLENSSAIRRLGAIEVSLVGETATLRGAVASERERNLARLLVLFEPGIYAVKNELTVRSANATGESGRPRGLGPQHRPETQPVRPSAPRTFPRHGMVPR